MNHTLSFFGALMFLAACGAPDDKWCKYNRCALAGERTFTPDESLRSMAVTVASRWSHATGLAITVADGGIPIKFVDTVYKMKSKTQRAVDKDGNFIPLCGAELHETPKDRSGVRFISIQISKNPPEGCPNTMQTLLHEVGHTLNPEGGHTDRGAMSETDVIRGIDDVSLTWACESSPCSTFEPELYMTEEAVQ